MLCSTTLKLLCVAVTLFAAPATANAQNIYDFRNRLSLMESFADSMGIAEYCRLAEDALFYQGEIDELMEESARRDGLTSSLVARLHSVLQETRLQAISRSRTLNENCADFSTQSRTTIAEIRRIKGR